MNVNRGGMRTSAITASAMLCATLGCGEEPTPPIVDVYRTTAVMGIVVRDAGMAPVAGVLVRTSTYLFVCGEQLRGGTGGQATGPEGQRRVLASSLDSPHIVRCVRVTVSQREAPNATLGEQDFPVELEFRIHDGTPRDSVGLEIVLP